MSEKPLFLDPKMMAQDKHIYCTWCIYFAHVFQEDKINTMQASPGTCRIAEQSCESEG